MALRDSGTLFYQSGTSWPRPARKARAAVRVDPVHALRSILARGVCAFVHVALTIRARPPSRASAMKASIRGSAASAIVEAGIHATRAGLLCALAVFAIKADRTCTGIVVQPCCARTIVETWSQLCTLVNHRLTRWPGPACWARTRKAIYGIGANTVIFAWYTSAFVHFAMAIVPFPSQWTGTHK